jgi:UDP-N-acetylglucosamine--N-acetylmuramyl-(pentapeptide) pyrophosphoryl-undecaprenol N-acetylglucosamine transferase
MAGKTSLTGQKVIFAGGGTAGHVEPALAVGSWLKANRPEILCEFVGTAEGLENHLVPSSGFTLHRISKVPLPRGLSPQTFTWPLSFLQSVSQARKAIKGADVVVGFGGYVCASVYVAARLKKIPIIVHEANALPGWANRLGVKLGGSPIVAFEKSRSAHPTWARAENVGIPLRPSIVELSQADEESREEIKTRKCKEWGFDPERPVLLVFGGSQGSQHINRVIEESRDLLSRTGVQVIHGVGRNNPLPVAGDGYKAIHYFDDLPEAYIASDLVICRSGAVTCHELSALRKYALLIPLDIGNGEQKLNGESLVDVGAAGMVGNGEFTSRWFSENILGLIAAGKKWNSTSHPALVPLNAAQRIGNLIIESLEIHP